MNKQTIIGLGIAVLLIVSGVIGFSFKAGPVNIGSADLTSAIARFASSSNPVIGTVPVGIVGTTTCSARIVTTEALGVSLAFFDQPLDGANLGEYQAASTTAVYDSATYGCGEMRARSTGATIIQIKDVN